MNLLDVGPETSVNDTVQTNKRTNITEHIYKTYT